ncbi:hypothetical protein [Micromonospora maris]|uniref:hypothetical protein n=1 Tax=Micromonospora maris TaxID=1003110 RepID=UPI002E10D5DC|nr:hypothetical protein OG712_20095 [Micromonospora maris]
MPTPPKRLWWHLDDVLPLAEHALAAREHRITGQQVLAKAATKAALIWDSEPDGDWIGSNGVPLWYDKDGSPRRVQAHTWLHTPTGTRGTPGQPDRAAGFLRLDRTYRDPKRQSLIKLLRRGAATGGHWLALDPTALHTTAGVEVLDHRDDIAPPDATWAPATVTADAVADLEYPALVAVDYTALGGVLARFDYATVRQIADDLDLVRIGDMPGEHPIITWDHDTAVISWEADDGHTTRRIEADRVHPDTSGRYSLAAYLWPWRTTTTHHPASPNTQK